MDKDYQNFLDRMGSFEDTIDLSDMSKNIEHGKLPVTRNRGAALAHFGIPGMKWGHHKAVNSTTVGAAAKTGQKVAELGQTVNRSTYSGKNLKKAKSMSDDDLKKITNRLNLENNYMNAANQQSGRNKVDAILSTAGSTLAVAASAATLVQLISKARG